MDTNLCISVILDVVARYTSPYSLAVLSSVEFKVKYLTSSIDVLQIYVSVEEDKIKTIENIFPLMKQ